MDASLRRSIYWLMLAATTGIMVARVANAEFVLAPSFYKVEGRKWPAERPEPWPTFSSNDRSRWATVKALVEQGTFAIGRRVEDPGAKDGYRDEGIAFTDGFGSVDKVLHPDTHEFFATKPPLLTLFVAGQYWVLRQGLHKDMVEDKWEVAVPILIVTNVLPLVLALWLLTRILERHGTTDWGRLFVFAAACFATFLPTFANTLNNHVPAACFVTYALYALLTWSKAGNRLPSDVERSEWYPQMGQEETTPEEDNPGSPLWLLVVGLFTGLTVCLELPAAALAGAIGLILLVRFPRGLVFFVPALLLPIAAQAFVNYKAMGTWEPVYTKFGGPWYEYPGSHWSKPKLWAEGKAEKPEHPGIDFAEEPKEVYALHFLVGHHGLFSLTPVWLLALAGTAMKAPGMSGVAGWLLRLTLPMAAAVIGFYIWWTNNYGGYTSGPRWLFWLTPLFLFALVPAADAAGRSRVGRGVAYLVLAASAFSATYPWANPWRHPWIYQWCEYMGWVKY